MPSYCLTSVLLLILSGAGAACKLLIVDGGGSSGFSLRASQLDVYVGWCVCVCVCVFVYVCLGVLGCVCVCVPGVLVPSGDEILAFSGMMVMPSP